MTEGYAAVRIPGDWYISQADIDGQKMQFDEDSGMFMILSFLDDLALVTEYADGEQTMRISANVEFDDEGNPYFIYDDPSGLTEQIDYEIYTVTKLSGDEKELTVSLDFYDDDTGRLGGYTLYFTR